jgi:flavin reductase (DIM6/NTAB) family NADH-FMN oxidoreductase RutF
MRKEVDLSLATRLINHGPVVLVSSLHGSRMDITPVAWNMPLQKNPPVIVLEIGESHFIYECIMETGDFVVNIPSSLLAEEVVKCGSVSGRDVDKFEMCSFEIDKSHAVKSPTLKMAMGVLECSLVRDEHLLQEYNMVVGEVKYAAADEGAFGEHWFFADEGRKTLHHLGNKTFCSPANGIIDLRQT